MCPRIFALARLQSVGFPQSRSFLYLRVLLDFRVQWLGPRNQQGAVCVMSGRPSQGASAVLKGAPLAPLRFLDAHSCLVASSCIEGSGPDQLSSDYWTTWVTTAKKYKCADSQTVKSPTLFVCRV